MSNYIHGYSIPRMPPKFEDCFILDDYPNPTFHAWVSNNTKNGMMEIYRTPIIMIDINRAKLWTGVYGTIFPAISLITHNYSKNNLEEGYIYLGKVKDTILTIEERKKIYDEMDKLEKQ